MAEKASFFIDVKSKGAKKASNEFKNLNKNVNGLSSSVKKLAVVFGAGFLGKQLFDGARGAVQTAATFETLKVRLTSLYGSVQQGTKAFDNFNKVAASTPFQLQDVVDAGASLKAFGLDAEEMIKPLADLAAFMQVDMSVAASNMGRAFVAGAGAADMFREKGINQMIADMAGVMDATKLPISKYRETLQKVLVDPKSGIAGMTTKMADTWNGAVSNFQDGIDRLKAAIGDQLIAVLRPRLDAVNATLSRLGEIGWENVGRAFLNNWKEIFKQLSGVFFESGMFLGKALVKGFGVGIDEINLQVSRLNRFVFQNVPLWGKFFEDSHKRLTAKIEFDNQKLVNDYKRRIQDIKVEWGSIFTKIEEEATTHSTNMQNILASHQGYMAQFAGDVNPFVPTTTQIEKNKENISIEQAMLNDKKAFLEQKGEEFKNLGVSDAEIEKWKQEQIAIYQKKDLQSRLKIGSQLMGSLASLNKAAKGSALVTARIQQGQAVIDGIASVQGTLAPPPRGYGYTPIGIAASIAAGATALANVAEIEKSMKSFATGGSFITSGSEAIMVGDNASGREVVNVTPLDAAGEPTGGGGMITVNVSGNVMSENYTEDVIIPHIKEALRRGESIA